GGLSAGMAYPTTLALITALWSGAPRTRSIALWSAVGGAIAALGPLAAGIALQHFWWGSAFLLPLPLPFFPPFLAFRPLPSPPTRTRAPGQSTPSEASSRCCSSRQFSLRSTSRRFPTRGR